MNKFNQKHMAILELDKVLKLLSRFCSCADSKAAAEELWPDSGFSEAKMRMSETVCAHSLIAKFSSPSFGGLKNVNRSLTRAASGGVLSMRELLDIGEVLRVIRSLDEWRKNHTLGYETPLDVYFNALAPNKFLEQRITDAVLSEDEISDNASPALYDIRRKIRQASTRVREQLDKIIHSQTFQKFLQEPIVTLRGGRYVVPVKAEFRSQIQGLVHDVSSSGSTVFIEPVSVVEANNEIKVLESEERAEIERILAELSALAGEYCDSIKQSYDVCVALDLLFAKARLAYDMKAQEPVLCDDGRIDLKKARHPLLDKNRVVPIDIRLGGEFNSLVITGPNTGGKTVSLKTLGLMTLMVMCGLMIPAAEGSRVSVFDAVLADIGDEQSIEQSLSTFSSHMTNIIEILKQADFRCLVLIDELGAGTDPAEGAALAIAILEDLRERGCRITATTHYAELKLYALQTPGVKNACCEFDIETLRPTYRLLIGLPGRSNAFAILKRLGMDEKIIEHSKSLVSSDTAKFEEVVEQLQESHKTLEQEKQDVLQLKWQAQTAETAARERAETVGREREKILGEARTQAKQLVASARAESNRLLNELEELKKQISGENAADMVKRARAAAKAGIEKIENAADPVEKRRHPDYRLPRPLVAGDNVEIIDIDTKGVVINPPDTSGYAYIQAGIIKTKVKTDNLRLTENKPASNLKSVLPRSTHGIESRATRSASTEIDLRGKRADEALLELDNFIDSAIMSGIQTITVIHGKGTGALRSAVQQHLKTHRSVKTYRRGVYGEGEDGVTIVELC